MRDCFASLVAAVLHALRSAVLRVAPAVSGDRAARVDLVGGEVPLGVAPNEVRTAGRAGRVDAFALTRRPVLLIHAGGVASGMPGGPMACTQPSGLPKRATGFC